jgi:hypothetical protein
MQVFCFWTEKLNKMAILLKTDQLQLLLLQIIIKFGHQLFCGRSSLGKMQEVDFSYNL